MTPEQNAQSLAQRAAEHHASFFDPIKIASYFTLLDSMIHALAGIFGVAHSVVNSNGTVTPRNIHDVAADINAAANNATAAGLAPVESAQVAGIAATVAAHSEQLAGVSADVKALGDIVTSQSNNVSKALEALEQVPQLLNDVEQIKSMVKGVEPAGGQDTLPPSPEKVGE